MPVSDLANWNLHGPVHTLRTEFAEWDLSLEQWQAARNSNFVRFRADGRISESEAYNPDGSIARSSYVYDAEGRIQETRFGMNGAATSKAIYSYDEHGRLLRVVSVDQGGKERESESYSYSQDGKKTKLYFIPQQEPNVMFGYGIEGTTQAYSAPGATTVTTRYSEHGQPGEVLFCDDGQRLLRRVIFTRDSTGRLIREEMHFGEQIPFSGMEKELENASAEERDAAVTMIRNLFGANQVMSSTTYAYDAKGHLIERRTCTGQLGDHRSAFCYDDHGNPIEETDQHTSREMQMDETGNLHPTKENSHKQHVRFEYRYDDHGNWTERIVWNRWEANPNFERSNVERREITYYAG
jgi:antitoxin component YwqK of YwqJK toxin-antitoxin module